VCDSHIRAKTIALTAQNGAIGTAGTPLDIDTDAANGGKLSANAAGGMININEVIGDLIIDLINASGNGTVNITADGGIRVGTITSTGGGNVTLTTGDGDIIQSVNDNTGSAEAAAEAQTAADQARSAADLAAAQVIILQNYVTNILPEILGRPAAQQELDKAVSDLSAAEQKLLNIKAQILTAQVI
jgi:hypothetical protein